MSLLNLPDELIEKIFNNIKSINEYKNYCLINKQINNILRNNNKYKINLNNFYINHPFNKKENIIIDNNNIILDLYLESIPFNSKKKTQLICNFKNTSNNYFVIKYQVFIKNSLDEEIWSFPIKYIEMINNEKYCLIDDLDYNEKENLCPMYRYFKTDFEYMKGNIKFSKFLFISLKWQIIREIEN